MSDRRAIEKYSNFCRIPASVEDQSLDGPPFSYYTLDLCGNKPNTRSDYIIDAKSGYFRENRCGLRSSGRLTFIESILVDVELFGPVKGWVYNTTRVSPQRSYFFSEGQPYPDELPGLYLLLTGQPHQVGAEYVYDQSQVGVANRS